MSELCGHNSYWTTAYQNCVMCENASLKARIADLEQTILANVVDGAAIDATVIKNSVLTALRAQIAELERSKSGWICTAHQAAFYTLEQQMAKLRAQVATLTAERDTWKQKYEDGVRLWDPVYEVVLNERDHLRAQVATLTAERDEAQRQYSLIHDDVDYQQCCAVREQAEQERDQARADLLRALKDYKVRTVRWIPL